MRFPRAAAAGAVLCLVLAFVVLAAPLLAPGDPAAVGTMGNELQPPSASHPLGTDALGRDVLARLVHGGRASLLVGWFSVLVAMVLGTAVGLAAGLGPRWVDRLLMVVTDAFLAFPRVFLILLLISISTPSLGLVTVVLGLTGWMGVARLVRAETLSLRERDFVQAAHGMGLTPWRVAWVHVLPHLAATIVVAATLRIGTTILIESFLSFLGLGAQEPAISWGVMIQQGRGLLLEAWWLTTFPGLALTLTVLGYNLLGDGLRAVLDPRRSEVALRD